MRSALRALEGLEQQRRGRDAHGRARNRAPAKPGGKLREGRARAHNAGKWRMCLQHVSVTIFATCDYDHFHQNKLATARGSMLTLTTQEPDAAWATPHRRRQTGERASGRVSA